MFLICRACGHWKSLLRLVSNLGDDMMKRAPNLVFFHETILLIPRDRGTDNDLWPLLRAYNFAAPGAKTTVPTAAWLASPPNKLDS